MEWGVQGRRRGIMLTVALWLGVLGVCALLLMVAVVAVLSLTTEDTAQLLDQDVRR